MRNPIQVLTPSELVSLLDSWTPLRKVQQVHIHCTDHPNHAEFRGLASIEAMRKYHMSTGMSDIAQHLTADPNGLLWTGRPFDAMPASARGHNGTAEAGPFMIEMVGLFDKPDKGGKKPVDVFSDPQKAAVQATVCAVLRKFGLDEKAVIFHREFPKVAKTCPGSALDPAIFRAEIAAALRATPRRLNVTVPPSLARLRRDQDAIFGRGLEEDTAYSEVPEDATSHEEISHLTRWFERGVFDTDDGQRAVKDKYRELLPYVINTSQGLLSREGAMQTTLSDIQVLVRHHLAPAFDSASEAPCKHLLFFAHGGLNTEEGALDYAKAMVPWWRSHGVYPIFFVWESSLFQTLFQRPRELGRGAVPRTDLGDKILEGITQKAARLVWRRMKANARRCSARTTDHGEAGGLFQFWQELKTWLGEQKGSIPLHAIGHSTGPILLAEFLKLVTADQFEVTTLNYLAPAIRIDDFLTHVEPLLSRGPTAGIRRLRQLTMNDEAERDDTVGFVYRKSLLYYVRQACEDDTGGRIMGLERDLYADPRMRALFGLPGQAGVLRSPADVVMDPLARIEFAAARESYERNPRTHATAHGCFDNEEATMTTVLRGILGLGDSDPISDERKFPWPGSSACGGDEGTRASFDDDLTTAFGAGGCNCCCHGAASEDDFDAAFDDDESALDDPDRSDSAGGIGATTPVGRRIALCVGINRYPRSPLSGCVADSKNWAAALRRHGFEIRKLHDGEATRAALVAGLRDLIRDGRSGDQLVFQFAGHGSQVDDDSGDETDRFDEVVVPVDFDKGSLLIDDDIYLLCRDLRPGVTLTFLMDCCHSGTNTRFAPTLARARGGARPRFVFLNERDVAAHRKSRQSMRAAPPVNERIPLAGVVSVAACRDNEVALEENGQGNFSRHALAVIDEVLKTGGSNADFLAEVVAHFGDDRRQRPLLLEPAGGLERARFLGGR